MNEIEEKLKIEDMIYEVGGKHVMIDSDLAKLYGVETKRINEAVLGVGEESEKKT